MSPRRPESATRLREARTAADMSQPQLAAKAGFCPQFVCDLERKGFARTALWRVKNLAHVLGVSPLDLDPSLGEVPATFAKEGF